jgi:hypothetical protein
MYQNCKQTFVESGFYNVMQCHLHDCLWTFTDDLNVERLAILAGNHSSFIENIVGQGGFR